MLCETGIECPVCKLPLLFDDEDCGDQSEAWGGGNAFSSEGMTSPCPHVAAINATWIGGRNHVIAEQEGPEEWPGESDLNYRYNHPGYPINIHQDEVNEQLDTVTTSWQRWTDQVGPESAPVFVTALFSICPQSLAEEQHDRAVRELIDAPIRKAERKRAAKEARRSKWSEKQERRQLHAFVAIARCSAIPYHPPTQPDGLTCIWCGDRLPAQRTHYCLACRP